MIIQTNRFGEIEVGNDELITFPSGFLGFSKERLFVLLDDSQESPFKWLQSAENPKLAFIIIDPSIATSEYSIALTQEQLDKLDASDVDQLFTYVIVTMTSDLKDVTINLQGPLLINQEKRLGAQMVLTDRSYSTRHPLFGDKLQLVIPSENKEELENKKVVNG